MDRGGQTVGVRETLEARPAAMTAGVAAAIVACALLAWFQIRPAGGSGQTLGSAYFTVDDGKSTFADAATRIAPFDKDGRPAVRAAVFSCDAGKSTFVGYLQRVDPAALKAVKPGAGSGQAYGAAIAAQSAVEVKRPGEAKWIALRSAEGARILQVKCPDGLKGPPVEVTP